MRLTFKPSFSRALGLLGWLGLGFVQAGCAHPVVVAPSVAVHSRIGHFPVHAQVGVPGVVMYAPAPPRVVYVPRVDVPVHGWRHRHDHHNDRRGGHRGQRGHGDGHR
jgi:hypothetical protein